MQFLLLLYSAPEAWEAEGAPEMDEVLEGHGKLMSDLRSSRQYLGSNALQPAGSATTVRVRGGEVLSTDGPYAETRELLGGYYLVEAADLDEAKAIAARVPDARIGSVEIRAIRDVGL